jgi:hypothetical protein
MQDSIFLEDIPVSCRSEVLLHFTINIVLQIAAGEVGTHIHG